MAYVSVSDWRPEQVTEWLKGLDSCLLPYLHWFSNNEINGQQLLNLCPDELTHLGVLKIGHQELILEGVQHLRNFHYELDRENVQSLALRISCAARSLVNEVRHLSVEEQRIIPTQILSGVSYLVNQVKSLVSWLDRTPFAGLLEYSELKPQLLNLSLSIALSAKRDGFAESPVTNIYKRSKKLVRLADSVIQDGTDPMILQPAYLDVATLKKRTGEDLGFFLIPSFQMEHQIGDIKLSSPAHQSGKIELGDEVVQVNYQTVVGWALKKVIALIEESPNDLLLTLKRRPRHFKMYGQMYMKPYRLPSRKRAAPYSRWNEKIPSPRPEFLTIPHFEIPSRNTKEEEKLEDLVTSSSSDEEFPLAHSTSPTSMRLYLPKPRAPIQRRFTLSGPPKPSPQTGQFWRELQLERSWRSNQNNSEAGQKENEEMSGMPMREKSVSVGAGCSVAAAAACADILDTSATNDARSIIQLNKVKREAFFSNMGCPPKPTPPRGRLDKSRSTPAYDLGETDGKDVNAPQPSPRNIILENIPIRHHRPNDNQGATALSGSSSDPNYLEQKELEQEHGQMVNTINQTLHQDAEDDTFFTDVPPAPREIRPIPAERKFNLPPVPPKPKSRPLPPEPPPRLDHISLLSPSPPSSPSNPPSPSTATLSVTTEKDKTKNTLDHLKAIWTLGRNNSPRSTRKQNSILTRRRLVTSKELVNGDVSGILWHRRRRGAAIWAQGFFVIQGAAFYGFKHKDRPKADLFILLPGFTCSVAEEVKSKNYAFKIYHTGTVFYFAAETEEEMQQWLDCANLATTSLDDTRHGESPWWSETDSDSSDSEQTPDSCFPTGSRVGRFLGAPARSHQNLATDSTKCESPRKFSSLKKLSKSPPVSEGNDVASLDRKYLRFLTQKNVPVPVPTSQFRSYRRMQPPTAPPRLPVARADNPEIAQPRVIRLPGTESLGPSTIRIGGMEPPRLARRTFYSSNPSLVNTDMADYRRIQESLREFRNLRTQDRHVDLSGFMTLEQFMLSRQEEERNLRSNRQTRTRVYPSESREQPTEVTRREQLASSSDKPQVLPRTIIPGTKPKKSTSSSSFPISSEPTQIEEGMVESRSSHSVTTILPDYPGIEYPPAFEPETYTLQYMLKNRRKKDTTHK